jgi:hypothetical protein
MKINGKSDLQQDRRNGNSGSIRGDAATAESLARFGAGRSILVDKNGKIIAGNTTERNWDGDIEVIETDGSKLVVVQRTDLDLDVDPEARALAHADNRTNQLGYTPNVERISDDLKSGIDLNFLWRADELEALKGVKLEPAGAEYTPDVPNFEKAVRNSGYEIVVVCNSEEEMQTARKSIQDLGYFTK